MQRSDGRTTVHVVSHFHWDREWHKSFREFQIRLVKAIDRLIKQMLEGDGFNYFLLDGQCIIIRDYLEIRTENSESFLDLIRKGKIEAGPFYVQADECLVSGESIIRNLLIGRRILKEYDLGEGMKVGYLPDQFGHSSQIPQILKKSGIRSVVFGRGRTIAEGDKSEMIWCSPDGSEILAITQIEFYNNAETLPESLGDLDEMVQKSIERTENSMNVKNARLFMNGRDHYYPQTNIGVILKNSESISGNYEIKHSRLEDFTDFIAENTSNLSKIVGELRQGVVLSNTASARLYLKIANLRNEILLENWVEPFSAINTLLMDRQYPSAFINKAWEILLKSHAHDSICGCSIDKVHDKMMTRNGEVEDIANTITNETLTDIVRHIKKDNKYEHVITVFNPIGWSRNENVSATIDFPADRMVHSFKIFDDEGKETPYQITNISKTKVVDCPERFIPFPKAVKRFEILMKAEVPAVGYRTYYISGDSKESDLFFNKISANVSSNDTDFIYTNGVNDMENKYLKVHINPNGTLDIFDKMNNQLYKSIGLYEDMGDRGDEYFYIKPLIDKTITTVNATPAISLVNPGNRKIEFKIDFNLSVPASLDENREKRLEEYTDLSIESIVSLEVDSRRVDIKGCIYNTAKDHRLRMLIPTESKASHIHVHNPFDVLERPIDLAQTKYSESTFPQHYFVSMTDEKRSLTVANFGLMEYEALEDRTVAITLVRCVDRLGVSLDAGGMSFTPGAQCPGKNEFQISIIPHQQRWDLQGIYKEAYNFNVPMKAVSLPVNEKYIECGNWHDPAWITPLYKEFNTESCCLPASESMLDIKTDGLILSAFKQAEDGENIVVRFYNIFDWEMDAKIVFNFDFKGIVETDLMENPVADSRIKTDSRLVSIPVGKKEIITLKLYR